MGIQITQQKRKYVSFIFPQATNKTLSICFKQLIRIKNLKRLNKLHLNVSINWTDPLTNFLNNMPITSSEMNRRFLTAANKCYDRVLFNKGCIFCNEMDINGQKLECKVLEQRKDFHILNLEMVLLFKK